jgi:hypothetical protein
MGKRAAGLPDTYRYLPAMLRGDLVAILKSTQKMDASNPMD